VSLYNQILHDNYEAEKAYRNCRNGGRTDAECRLQFPQRPLPPLRPPAGVPLPARGTGGILFGDVAEFFQPTHPLPTRIGAPAPGMPPPAPFPPPPGPRAVPDLAAREGVYVSPVPPPTGEPISTAIIAVLSAVFSIFGLFRRKPDYQRQLDALRDGLRTTTEALERFAWKIARGVGVLLMSVQTIWVRVLRPILQRIDAVIARVNRIIDRILKPYLDVLLRIRQMMLDIYERIFRPILVTLQTVRRILAILRILRVPFAEKLDRRLARLEQKITEPLRVLLDKVNELSQWLNILLSIQGVLEAGIFTRTLGTYADHAAGWWWYAHTRTFDPALRAGLYPSAIAGGPDKAVADAREVLRTGGGPLQAAIERIDGVVRSAAQAA
jgi:hypothetical protein